LSVVDLHLHSTASDGTVSPEEVVARAARAGMVGLSLTDHDTTAGLERARTEAERRGLRFLPGTELSANEPGQSVHLLAFGFDPEEPRLAEFMWSVIEDRIRRARDIVARLQELGVGLTYEAIVGEAGNGAITRAHVARALVAGGFMSNVPAAFGRLLGRGRPAFVDKKSLPPGMVIERVHDAGGVVILAHPGRSHRIADIGRWIEEGLDGVEIRHPANPPEVRASLEEMVRQHGLLRSGGSDWHGPDSKRADIGSQQVPVEWLDAIEARCTGVRTARPGNATGGE